VQQPKHVIIIIIIIIARQPSVKSIGLADGLATKTEQHAKAVDI
jgi:hypothetical protein